MEYLWNLRTSTTTPVLSHLLGRGPVWFWIWTRVPTVSGGKDLVCSLQRLSAMACLERSALSRMSKFCFHMVWRSNLPGRMGIRSFTGLPNTHMAGDIRVAGSGVFLYCRTALWKASESRLPFAVTLPVSRRFIVLTPTSARQLLWGNATELRR